MTNLHTIAFYATPEHECSYLDDQRATTMFVDPKVAVSTELYTELSRLGFRRSGNNHYRPHCDLCQACIPIRIPTAQFRPSRSQKRVIKANQNTQVQIMKADFHEDHYLLYEKYITQRHRDGDMYPPGREQFRSFLVNGHSSTQFIEFSLEQRPVGIAVIDELLDGLSAIYTFYDPDYAQLSLGTYAVLWQIQQAQAKGLPYVYLGYFIRQCQKMNYKTKFRPFEARIEEQWLSDGQLQAIIEQSPHNS